MIPSPPQSVEELDEVLSDPPQRVIESLRHTDGDIAVLGAGGKMGFDLCRMLRRALDALGADRRVFAVSRFGREGSRDRFETAGIDTLAADLSDAAAVEQLPEAPNIFFLAGVKFGTSSDADLLHRMNVVMPRLVADRYHRSRIVAMSTGCVYSFTSPDSGGSTEQNETDPPGAYAVSCKGREQAFFDAAAQYGTHSVLVRLNYAIDLRYGVLVDIAQRVFAGKPVNIDMGYVNVIWQRDAIDHVIQSLPRAASPPQVINVTGQDILRVRDLAHAFGERFGRQVELAGKEAPTAWLNNPRRAHAWFGAPRTSLDQMIAWIVDWIERGGETLGKPTHFENREGNY